MWTQEELVHRGRGNEVFSERLYKKLGFRCAKFIALGDSQENRSMRERLFVYKAQKKKVLT